MNPVELDLLLLLVNRDFFDFGGVIIDADGIALGQRDSHAAVDEIEPQSANCYRKWNRTLLWIC